MLKFVYIYAMVFHLLTFFINFFLIQFLNCNEKKYIYFNQQCIVYEFKCNLCDAGYVGYTRGHLHERVEGHT